LPSRMPTLSQSCAAAPPFACVSMALTTPERKHRGGARDCSQRSWRLELSSETQDRFHRLVAVMILPDGRCQGNCNGLEQESTGMAGLRRDADPAAP
jgi:hypothetical protein